MRGVFFFGFIFGMIINANFLPIGLVYIAPLSILGAYFILGPIFKKLDKPLRKTDSSKIE